MRPNYLEILKQKYDKEVRENCDKFLNDLNLCIKDHFNDEFTCRPYKTSFEDCIKNYNKRSEEHTSELQSRQYRMPSSA